MNTNKLEVGKFYELVTGSVGKLLDKEKRWPVAFRFQVVWPMPRETFVTPREIKCEVPEPKL